MKKPTTYERYMEKVIMAQNSGFSPVAIITELREEIQRINMRSMKKAAELSLNKNPYPRREVIRSAQECTATLEKIIGELKQKESLV